MADTRVPELDDLLDFLKSLGDRGAKGARTLAHAVAPFPEEIKADHEEMKDEMLRRLRGLLQVIHPDKNGGSEIAKKMTERADNPTGSIFRELSALASAEGPEALKSRAAASRHVFDFMGLPVEVVGNEVVLSAAQQREAEAEATKGRLVAHKAEQICTDQVSSLLLDWATDTEKKGQSADTCMKVGSYLGNNVLLPLRILQSRWFPTTKDVRQAVTTYERENTTMKKKIEEMCEQAKGKTSKKRKSLGPSTAEASLPKRKKLVAAKALSKLEANRPPPLLIPVINPPPDEPFLDDSATGDSTLPPLEDLGHTLGRCAISLATPAHPTSPFGNGSEDTFSLSGRLSDGFLSDHEGDAESVAHGATASVDRLTQDQRREMIRELLSLEPRTAPVQGTYKEWEALVHHWWTLDPNSPERNCTAGPKNYYYERNVCYIVQLCTRNLEAITLREITEINKKMITRQKRFVSHCGVGTSPWNGFQGFLAKQTPDGIQKLLNTAPPRDRPVKMIRESEFVAETFAPTLPQAQTPAAFMNQGDVPEGISEDVFDFEHTGHDPGDADTAFEV